MKKKKDDLKSLKSGIYYNEEDDNIILKFGGKIGIKVSSDSEGKEQYIHFNELEKKMKMGELIPRGNKKKVFQNEIILIFDKRESINILIENLEYIKALLPIE